MLKRRIKTAAGQVVRFWRRCVWLVPDSNITFSCQLNSLISSDRLIFSFRDTTSFSPPARIMEEQENARNRSIVVQSTVELVADGSYRLLKRELLKKDLTNEEEQENARNRSIVVQSTVELVADGSYRLLKRELLKKDLTNEGCTSILPAAFESEGMVECNYDATSKITGGWILRGHLGVALRGKYDRL
ncbi:hypothetical protein F2Q69_00019691 [Brassica cretica]|uniref:Uncharacterized protein n=1 Tax=Brassica cretica TaxID=69181 RepID=A0A8S9QMY7_BRACR|nr:hypothetical protein F2Q69_00019691 [Brassica cretica]